MREPCGAAPLDLLQLPFQDFPADHVIGWRDDAAITLRHFRADILRWSALLQSAPGQRFALFHQDTLHFAAALFGAWRAGKTVYLPSDTLPATCSLLQAQVDGFLGQFEPAWPALQADPHQPIVDDGHAWPALAGDFPGLVVYTSGSTGQAQAIPKKLAQMANEVATLEALFGASIGTADILATVSHQHIYGLLFKVLWPISSGRAVHAQSAFFPEDLQRMVPARPWVLLSSPAHLKRLPEQATRPDTLQLRAIFSSGGPLPAASAHQVAQMCGHRPLEIYGSSETGGIAWRQPDADPARRREHWQAMPGIALRVDEEGQLEVRSPHLPDQQWFSMADRAELGTDGFVLRGRADRIVKLEEKRISLTGIEELLAASPLVADARVLVHQGKRARQYIAAFVVPSQAGGDLLRGQGKLALNAALRATLAGAIEGIALPRLWRYLDAMPVNAQGKITQSALLALLESPAAPGVLPVRPVPTAPTMPIVTPLQLTAQHVQLSLQVPPDLLYFNGHFPGAPILPGVVQTDWALALGRRHFALPPRFLGVNALKFQRVITPGMTVMLDLQYDADKATLAFRLHSAGGQHASGRFLLGPP